MSAFKLVYIGSHFYFESSTMMSSLYTEDGLRSDWGKVECALRDGQQVEIRPATQSEADRYEGILARWKREHGQPAASPRKGESDA